MKTGKHSILAILFVSAFFLLVLGIALAVKIRYPLQVISGEASAGTWLSGVLLVISATLALIISLQRNWYPWLILSAFFLLLAADERFMLHEALKERILFSLAPKKGNDWIGELPVIFGACAGLFSVVVLWKHLRFSGMILILAVILLGGSSVLIDILGAGVFWEDSLKLLAEIILVFTLLTETGITQGQTSA